MAILPKCPSCGMESPELRCPRCNTLKVIGCSGSCTLCNSKKGCETPTTTPPSPAEKPGGTCCG